MGFASIIVITSILLACTPVLLHLFSFGEMLSNTYAAILGVALTAIISWALLNGQFMLQAEKDLERDKLSTVYEEKLRLYQRFLRRLYSIIQDNIVEREEALELQFELATLSIHTKPGNIAIISRALQDIQDSLGGSKSSAESWQACDSAENDEYKLMASLQQIVQVFREELYVGKGISREQKARDCETLKQALTGFTITDSVNQEIPKDANTPDSAAEKVLRMLAARLAGDASISANFNLQDNPADGWLKLTPLHEYESRHDLRIQFALDGDGSYYFQAHWQFDNDQQRRRTYKTLRSLYGGGFNKWCWWNRLTADQQHLLRQPHIQDADARALCDSIFALFQAAIPWVKQFSLSYKVYTELCNQFPAPAWDVRLWQDRYIGLYFSGNPANAENPITISISAAKAAEGKYSLALDNEGAGGCDPLMEFARQIQKCSGISQEKMEGNVLIYKEEVSLEEIYQTLQGIRKAYES